MMSANFHIMVRLMAYPRSRLSQAATAWLLIGLVLLLNAMASSPALHEWFHADAGQAEHQCAVTLFAHGQVDSSTVDVVHPAPLTLLTACVIAELPDFSPTLRLLPAERAPPVSLAHS
jgi:hypothetical protein